MKTCSLHHGGEGLAMRRTADLRNKLRIPFWRRFILCCNRRRGGMMLPHESFHDPAPL